MEIALFFMIFASFHAISQAILDDYSVFINGNDYWIANFDTITVPNHLIVKRPNGTAPEHCVRTASDNQYCSPYNLEVYDIYYADCHAPWVVCRCLSAPASFNISAIANNIGVPVRARSWVRHFSYYGLLQDIAAYSTLYDINVFGNYGLSWLLYHETGHNLDLWVAANGKPESLYSVSDAWQSQAALDTCVPTMYSKSAWEEDFAETVVQATYEENFGAIPVNASCFNHTLTRARSLLRSAIKIVPGDLCIDRITPSTSICMGPAARAAGLCNDVLDTTQTSAVNAKVVEADLPVFTRLAKDQRDFDERVAKAYAEMMANGPAKSSSTSKYS